MTPAGAAPPISIVVPTRNRPDMLRRCLETVVATRRDIDELIVVDSASTDADAVRQVAESMGARLVRCDIKGETVARNAGWRAATNEHVVYVDDDVWVDERWGPAFANAFVEHPDDAFFTGRIEVPPHQVPTDRPVSIKEDPESHVIDLTTQGTLGHAASLAVRRSIIDAEGGFDELLGAGGRFPGAPELDLFDRLLSKGMTGRYEASALAWHDQWRDRNELVGLDYRYGVGGGARLAKLLRTNRRRARGVIEAAFWEYGFKEVWINLRKGWQYGALMRLAHMAGIVVGAVQGLAIPLDDAGHLRPRRSPSTSS
jgi:glycosyltransferase involved in cell wall biosynthesis